MACLMSCNGICTLIIGIPGTRFYFNKEDKGLEFQIILE